MTPSVSVSDVGGLRESVQPQVLLQIPYVAAVGAKNLDASTAWLSGIVNPEGLATTYQFRWGTASGVYTLSSASTSAGAAGFPLTIGAAAQSLVPGTPYYFVVQATNARGTVTSAEVAFVFAIPVTNPNVFEPNVPPSLTVEIPHFVYPFTMTNSGAVVAEQDAIEEVFSCVFAIASCATGECEELPSFGIPDVTFQQAIPDPSALINAVQQQEPRATESVILESLGSPETGEWNIDMLTTIAGASVA